MKGKVKFYNPKEGYGFITGEDRKDYFVHNSGIVMNGYRKLRNRQEVEFDIKPSERGDMADNVKVIE